MQTTKEEVIELAKNPSVESMKKLLKLGFFVVSYYTREDTIVVQGMKSIVDMDSTEFVFDGDMHWDYYQDNVNIVLSE